MEAEFTAQRRHFSWFVIVSVACIVGVIASLSLAGTGDRTKQILAWGGQPWTEHSCSLERAGIAYRGTCEYNMTVIATLFTNYTECSHAVEQVFDKVQRKRSKACTEAADAALLKPGHIFSDPTEYAPNESANASSSATERVLRSWRKYRLSSCYDAFLLWTLIRSVHSASTTEADAEQAPSSTANESDVEGTTQQSNQTTIAMSQSCAYEYGSADVSLTDEWKDVEVRMDEVSAAIDLQIPVPCWTLPGSKCVIALEDPAKKSKEVWQESNQRKMAAVVCAGITVVLFICCLWCFRGSLLHFLFRYPKKLMGHCSSTGYLRVPMAEPISERRVRKIAKKIVRTAVARIHEESPHPSAPCSGRANLAHELVDSQQLH